MRRYQYDAADGLATACKGFIVHCNFRKYGCY